MRLTKLNALRNELSVLERMIDDAQDECKMLLQEAVSEIDNVIQGEILDLEIATEVLKKEIQEKKTLKDFFLKYFATKRTA